MEAESDDDLYRRYRRGNAKAFDALYEPYRQPIYHYIRKSVAENRVEELYQDVWVKVIASSTKYHEKGRFRQWIFTCAHHLIVDEYRRKDRGVEVPLPELTDKNNDSCGTLQTQLNSALLSLPIEQRQVFYLRHELDCSLKDIAEIVGCKPEAAKSRLRYAYTKLKSLLGGEK